MNSKETIAVYIPRWLYKDDVGITIFVNGLYRSVRESGKYRLLKVSPRLRSIKSKEEAEAFVKKHNIKLIIYHDTRALAPNKPDGLNFLEECVPFLNPLSVHVADDKFETKRLLKEVGVPVLPDFKIMNSQALRQAMVEGDLYTIKPHNSGSGEGVKLVKRDTRGFFEFLDGAWRKISITDTSKGIKVSGRWYSKHFILVILLMVATSVFAYLAVFQAFPYAFISLVLVGFIVENLPKVNHNFTYKPLMLEPFFGDSIDEFYCLRCTVIGDEVVESARKTNKKNVTPNISHGGKATKITLTKEQQEMAVKASRAVGAHYTGVDLLYAGGKTVVCEVNVGPIGLYCEQSGVDVGGILGNYAMSMCDKNNS